MTGSSNNNALRAVLHERGWSYTRLATELRRHAGGSALAKTESLVTLISRWVNNHQQPDDFYRDLLAKALGRSRTDLFGDEGTQVELAASVAPAELPHDVADFIGRASEIDECRRRLLGTGRVAPPTLVGYLTAGATPVWLLGSFAVLSLLYRADTSADPPVVSGERSPTGAGSAPSSAYAQPADAEALTKRAKAERVYAELSANGAPPKSAQLAAAAGLSTSYARALVAEFDARPRAAVQSNGRRRTVSAMAEGDSEIGDD